MEGLNDQQRQAVEAGEGPLLIIAGPGTGKTRTLTARIAHLISGGVKPEYILALTFTNKAAREMRERVGKTTGKSQPLITTFHALAQKLLADTMQDLNLVSDAGRTAIIKGLKKPGVKLSVRDISLILSRAKNSLAPPTHENERELVAAYNAELQAQSLYDFDDLLLRLHAQLAQGTVPPFSYILVDEFQDTNDLQFELLKLLDTTGNLFVIGDPLQSIYGFRGASAAVFKRFKQEWPAAVQIHLAVNYRSVEPVVRAANSIFPTAPQLFAYRQDKGSVSAVEALNEYGEADYIIDHIEQQIGGSDMLKGSVHHGSNHQRTFKNFAILYRTHAAAKAVKRALEKSGIPYQVAGEGSPYLQPHIVVIVDCLAYLAGKSEAPPYKTLTTAHMQALLDGLDAAQPVSALADDIIRRLDLSTDKTGPGLRQFVATLVRHDDKPLGAYVDHVQAIAEQEYYDPQADAVTLLTIHAAKGLEFSQVFLIASEQGVLPHIHKASNTNIDEEKRLFYVAVTRARDDLYILHARKRGGEACTISEFITALPGSIVPRSVDPQLANQVRQLQRRQQKRAQGSLF